MNTASPCHSDFFTVAASRAELRIRNDEVVGSSPTSSTKYFPIKMPTRLQRVVMWSAELCRLPQFDGIPLRIIQTSEAPDVGVGFRVFNLNSRRS